MTSSYRTLAALLLLPFAACWSDSVDPAMFPPLVLSTSPVDGTNGVPLNGSLSVTFNRAMDPATLTAASFTLTSGATPVQGTVTYSHAVAALWPAARLASHATFTATITTGATSVLGVPLEANHAWRITTGDTTTSELPVSLGTAGNFAILAKSGISTVPTSAITGNIGVSPAAATYITGFSLTADSTHVFASSLQVTGRVYAADYAPPTPSNMTTAVGDMEAAFSDAAARAPDVTGLGAGNIGGMTLAPGVYRWVTGLLIAADVTLTGSATDVWIFQIGQDLTMSSAAKVLLAGGAQPRNVFWQVAGRVDLGTAAHCEGVVLTRTSATLRTGASIHGRLLAQTAVNIDGSTAVEPAP
jgi:hypothetical protein